MISHHTFRREHRTRPRLIFLGSVRLMRRGVWNSRTKVGGRIHSDALGETGGSNHFNGPAATEHRVFKESGRRGTRAAVTAWVLRELRPVSFSFKTANAKGTEAKALGVDGRRFGFVAQEVERTIPGIVKRNPKTDQRHLIYQDFIALLTMAAQEHQDTIERRRGEVASLRNAVGTLAVRVELISQEVLKFMDQHGQLPEDGRRNITS